MIKEFTNNPLEYVDLRSYQRNIQKHLSYLSNNLKKTAGIVLDIGSFTPMTEELIRAFSAISVVNTEGDLDADFILLGKPVCFNAVIYCHVMEHQFNPLNTLLKIKEWIDNNTQVFVMLPRRGKLLWDKTHYHEIDDYRFTKLCERAGYSIVSKAHKHQAREWWFYFTGIRPLMRLFFERMVYYEIRVRF